MSDDIIKYPNEDDSDLEILEYGIGQIQNQLEGYREVLQQAKSQRRIIKSQSEKITSLEGKITGMNEKLKEKDQAAYERIKYGEHYRNAPDDKVVSYDHSLPLSDMSDSLKKFTSKATKRDIVDKLCEMGYLENLRTASVNEKYRYQIHKKERTIWIYYFNKKIYKEIMDKLYELYGINETEIKSKAGIIEAK